MVAIWVKLSALAAAVAGVCLLIHGHGRGALHATQPPVTSAWAIYDADREHIWNRLHVSLFRRSASDGREYGHDELDALIWRDSKYLSNGIDHDRAVNLLDEFLATRAETLIDDPIKKAVLQRDLWAFFDWSVSTDGASPGAITKLQQNLARAIHRLALSADEIQRLTSGYPQTGILNPEMAQLPAELFDPNGPWLQLSVKPEEPTARGHVYYFGGRSAFLVFAKLPGGRAATKEYFEALAKFQKPWLRRSLQPAEVTPNPATPQFPIGTRFALVRMMLLVDKNGDIVSTRLIEGIQVRTHKKIGTTILDGVDLDNEEPRAAIEDHEFVLSRAKLFRRESGGLRAIARNEKAFPLFQSHGIDPFELSLRRNETVERWMINVLESCASCHFRPGIHAVLSRTPDLYALRIRNVRREVVASSDTTSEGKRTIDWKLKQESWRRLRKAMS